MSSRDYFVLGCKLIGVYLVFASIPLLSNAAATTIWPSEPLVPEYSKIIKLFRLSLWVIVAAQVGVGFYLLRYGRMIHDFAYPETSEPEALNLCNVFGLALKIFGVYLIITSFPDLVRSITSYLMKSDSPSWLDLSKSPEFATVSWAPSVVSIALGFYLLKADNLFARLAWRGKDQPDDESED